MRRPTHTRHPLYTHTRWLTALLIAASCAACAPPVVEPPPTPPAITLPAPNTLWVSPSETPDGKVIFKTIAAAIAAAKGHLIFIAEGTYKEALVIPADTSIHLECDPRKPAILAVPDGKVGITVEAKAKLSLHHITIEGGERGILLKKESQLNVQNARFNKMKGQGIYGEDADVQIANSRFADIEAPSEERKKVIDDPNGISLKRSSLRVHHCQFVEAGSKGILLQDFSDASIIHSTFTGKLPTALSAIAVESDSQASIANVTIDGWKQSIFYNHSKGSVTQTSINNARGNAVFITRQSWVRISDVTVKNPGGTGVSLSLSGGIVRNTSVENAGEYCIFVAQSDLDQELVMIEGNTVSKCKGAGIQVLNTTAIIRKNTVSGSLIGTAKDDGHGIGALDSNQVLVEGNEVKDCAGAGIFLNRTSGEIKDNIVSGNKESGILVTNAPPAPRLLLEKNTLDSNSISGVFLLGTLATFRQNKFTKTVFSTAEQSGSGLVIFGQSQADISEDTYENNGQHGILIAQGSSATVKKSTFTSNKGYGILIQCNSSKLTEDGNTYSKNTQGEKNTCP